MLSVTGRRRHEEIPSADPRCDSLFPSSFIVALPRILFPAARLRRAWPFRYDRSFWSIDGTTDDDLLFYAVEVKDTRKARAKAGNHYDALWKKGGIYVDDIPWAKRRGGDRR